MRHIASSGWPNNGYRNFQQAFIAALALEGCRVVVADGNQQHRAFDAATKKLQELRAMGVPGAKEFPVFHSTMVTGTYRDIDAALMLGQGLTVPGLRSVRISLSPDRAQYLLDDTWEVPQEQQEVLRQMAVVFLEHMPQWATIT